MKARQSVAMELLGMAQLLGLLYASPERYFQGGSGDEAEREQINALVAARDRARDESLGESG